MTTVLDAAWTEWMDATLIDTYERKNPNEYAKVVAYRGGGDRPTCRTHTGRALVFEIEEWLKTQPPPPPPPGGQLVDPPREPITRITSASGVGLNVTTKQLWHDVFIGRTGDTAVLFQHPEANGSSLTRAVLLDVAAGNAVDWGKHAVYAKAPNISLAHIRAECSGYAASGFSLRFNGARLRHFDVKGAGFAITYFETADQGQPGGVIIEDGVGTFRQDTGIWMDAETDYQSAIYQDFEIRRVHLTGPGSFFCKISGGRMRGRMLAEGCTLNGKPVTKAMFAGVPDLTIA